jgi:mRNA interferase MazF
MDPVRGHEQAGTRPVLIVSSDVMNHTPGKLVMVVPLTRTARQNPAHVRLLPPEGGVRDVSYAMCDQIRTITTERLGRRIGRVHPATLDLVAVPLRILLQL